MKDGGCETIGTPLMLYWDQEVVVTMAIDRCPALHPAWKIFLGKSKKVKVSVCSFRPYITDMFESEEIAANQSKR